ncbi:hypothetical protein ACFPM0_31685 [Pseudonocardia sulfidoxydans]|uniref:hypothetical protein n=1 Tax=Pseudonocardia sulfidoxydans TaxID=54011 RepID=UPI003607E224
MLRPRQARPFHGDRRAVTYGRTPRSRGGPAAPRSTRVRPVSAHLPAGLGSAGTNADAGTGVVR